MRKGKTDIQADFSIAGGSQIDAIQTDSTLPTNSDLKIPTEKAVKAFKPTDLNMTGQSAEEKLLFDGTNWVSLGTTELIFVGTFSRDQSLVSGTQAITGIGFKPAFIQFMANGEGSEVSWGWGTNSSNQAYSENHHKITANTFEGGTGTCIFMSDSSGNTYSGRIDTIDADGFSIDWTRTGTPTGTTNIRFVAFR